MINLDEQLQVSTDRLVSEGKYCLMTHFEISLHSLQTPAADWDTSRHQTRSLRAAANTVQFQYVLAFLLI